jgi:hypothetical protein
MSVQSCSSNCSCRIACHSIFNLTKNSSPNKKIHVSSEQHIFEVSKTVGRVKCEIYIIV